MKEVIIDGVVFVPKTETDSLAEVKAAFAAGKAVQFYSSCGGWLDHHAPGFSSAFEWRIKPEPKSDRSFTTPMDLTHAMCDCVDFTTSQWPGDNLRLTFDGETGKLKSAEVL
jgi:hypothetical protein